jgi:hypothetical protein
MQDFKDLKVGDEVIQKMYDDIQRVKGENK